MSSRQVEKVLIMAVRFTRASCTSGDSSVEEASLTGSGFFPVALLFFAARLDARLGGGASSSEVTLSYALALLLFFAPFPFLSFDLGGMIKLIQRSRRRKYL